MKPRLWPALIAGAGLLVSGLAGATGALAAPATGAAAIHGAAAGVGRGVGARAKSVNVRAAEAGRQLPVHAWTKGPLGRDGRPADAALPARRPDRAKATPAPAAARPGGPNSGKGLPGAPRALAVRAQAAPAVAPTTVNASFSGVNQAGSTCGACQPPDTNAAVGLTQIAEAVNLQLEVYSKTGVAQCGVGLNTFVGTSSALSDPHILYDNLNNRFLMDFTVVPTTGAAPSMYVLASQTSNACGSWWYYRPTFSGPAFPAGTLLDYPYLGQDQVSVLISTNNFCCAPSFGSYNNSAAFSIAKSLLYSGAAFSFNTYPVAFSTAPVTVSGIPIASTTTTYFLASVPGSGYDLYKMTTGPNNPITLQAAISSPFSAPSRRVNQPGTSQTLDPLDGRIVWAPVQSQGFVWFAHGVDRSGFPSVRYGAVSTAANTATVASAYHSATSDDFNPSIGVADAGTNVIYAWLNWAYTDSQHSIATSDTINGVLPGTGVPNLIGTDLTLVSGSSTSSNFRFGDFSSVEVDPTAASSSCPAGRTAVTNQEYFTSNGQWATRLARTSFC